MTLTLRPALPADAPAFHAVMMAAGMDPRSSWSRTRVEDVAWSLGQGGGFLAWQDGEAVGCVGWRPDGPQTLTLNKLATRPEVRGQGIGTALVRAVEDLAVRGGYARLLLAVSAYNLAVLPFYKRLGYRVDEGAVYAHANPQSPPPVVLVKALQRTL
ncbi:GNAT family N-acetyltransferase [Deinococcus sp. YIM 77859]|uniref:GNAT family N-acetyltransferase n=1 Tax=Deinococcus sp. YIM 77859 TaxID=1540221 RepID=UPI0005518002|nr:GNAT family N-acetyltransferase [Deinococcus sp. YIM 77859]